MAKDKYADAKRYIMTLEAAVEAHQLDGKAMAVELGRAAVHCRKQAMAAEKRRSLYSVATAIYVAKAKELTLGHRGNPGFKRWCLMHGMAYSTGSELAKIGCAVNVEDELGRVRRANRERVYASIERRTGQRPGDRKLLRMKLIWRWMTIEEREHFLAWASKERATSAAA